VDSAWPLVLYDGSGMTLLTDTNDNGIVDTGPMAQGSSTTLATEITVPYTATVGQSNNGQLIARSSVNPDRSKVALLQVAIPAPFRQSYVQSWSAYAGFYSSSGQVTQQTSDGSTYEPAIVTMPDGHIVQAWYQSRTNSHNQYVEELYYAVLDNAGSIVRSATRLTDHGRGNDGD